MNLKSVSEAALRQELARRDKAKTARPRLLRKRDLSHLLELFEEHVGQIALGNLSDDDYDDYIHRIHEEAARAFYGEYYFDWIAENR